MLNFVLLKVLAFSSTYHISEIFIHDLNMHHKLCLVTAFASVNYIIGTAISSVFKINRDNYLIPFCIILHTSLHLLISILHSCLHYSLESMTQANSTLFFPVTSLHVTASIFNHFRLD